jgi:hypothetical protein
MRLQYGDVFNSSFSFALQQGAPETHRAFTEERLRWVQSVTLHTNLGDLKLEIFCEEVPRTAENFLALCASGYYDTTIFHRNIRGWALI